jgi:hypothetical protein
MSPAAIAARLVALDSATALPLCLLSSSKAAFVTVCNSTTTTLVDRAALTRMQAMFDQWARQVRLPHT